MILRVPGDALLLRVAWIEARFPDGTYFCRPKMVLVELSHIEDVQI
jgi:hypothetical protein